MNDISLVCAYPNMKLQHQVINSLYSFFQDMESLEAPQCQLDFSPIYSITSSIVSFFLPCIIMLIIYFHLFAIAKHHLKEMKYVRSFFSCTRKLRK